MQASQPENQSRCVIALALMFVYSEYCFVMFVSLEKLRAHAMLNEISGDRPDCVGAPGEAALLSVRRRPPLRKKVCFELRFIFMSSY